MTSHLTRYEALTACLAKAGTQARMASDLEVSQGTISNWINRSRRMPAEYVLKAEELYGVSRHDLRPDIYPRDTMVDRMVEDRFFGIDLRARSAADRRLMADRFAHKQKVA